MSGFSYLAAHTTAIYVTSMFLTVLPSRVAPENVTLSGRGLVTAGERLPARFCIRTSDTWGNSLAVGGLAWDLQVSPFRARVFKA
jgi:hypothetical protein